jgi:hypothetical protein
MACIRARSYSTRRTTAAALYCLDSFDYIKEHSTMSVFKLQRKYPQLQQTELVSGDAEAQDRQLEPISALKLITVLYRNDTDYR